MKRILFISNGHGEDLIAARLAATLAGDPDLTIKALAIVGVGAAYREAGIPLILEGVNMPSGGFVRNGLRNLILDLKGGLWDLTRRQVRALRQAHAETDLAVCVGDSYLNFLAGVYLKRPVIFLPTAKSDYVSAHWRLERWLMRRVCIRIFPRDALTAQSLAGYGLPAEFAGNVMMDSLDFRGPDLKGPPGEWTVAVLPGSRQEAYENLEDIALVILEFERLLKQEGAAKAGRCLAARYLVALSGGLDMDTIFKRLGAMGWRSAAPAPGEIERGITGHLDYLNEVSLDPIRITFAKGRFADILAACDGVIGLAGTANEQAVGLGKPVVAFVGRGTQYTPKFVNTQKKLLGDSISVVDREPGVVARELFQILTDGPRRERMSRIGRDRMGGPGGVLRITAEIKRIAKQLGP